MPGWVLLRRSLWNTVLQERIHPAACSRLCAATACRAPARLTLKVLAATRMLAAGQACVLVWNICASKSRSGDAVVLTESALPAQHIRSTTATENPFPALGIYVRSICCSCASWGAEGSAAAPWLWARWNTPARGGWILSSCRNRQLSLAEHAALSNEDQLWVCKELASCVHHYAWTRAWSPSAQIRANPHYW